jgi:PhzF family phenazine biosynthesis protein
MKKIPIYQVDAFTDRLFSGNPAAVCLLESWPDAAWMQLVAAENNLAETAFVVTRGDDFEIRWFTPAVEVDLCGHATLASAYVIFNELKYPGSTIRFHSRNSGVLLVEKREDLLILDFPADTLAPVAGEDLFERLEQCLGIRPVELLRGKSDLLAVMENEETILMLQPDFEAISKLDARGLIVTARGEQADFVSRFFAPQVGVNEDPVTGSAHTSLIPYWADKLGKTKLTARQLSKRGGVLECEHRGTRCLIGGKARLYLTGEIEPV